MDHKRIVIMPDRTAREIAFQTNTPLVIEVDGEVRQVPVTEQDVLEYREAIKDAL